MRVTINFYGRKLFVEGDYDPEDHGTSTTPAFPGELNNLKVYNEENIDTTDEFLPSELHVIHDFAVEEAENEYQAKLRDKNW